MKSPHVSKTFTFYRTFSLLTGSAAVDAVSYGAVDARPPAGGGREMRLLVDTSVEWDTFIDHFNAGQFVEGVLPLEHLWFAGRDDFYKGLIRLCVALNQLRLGLITSPRFLLRTAHDLLAPYAPRHHGVDVQSLRAYILQCLEIIPADLETGQGAVDIAGLPAFRLDRPPR